MMVKFERFDYNGAARIIEAKGLLDEIDEVIGKVDPPLCTPAVRIMTGLLARRGWILEVNLLTDTDYRHDAFKDAVLVEIDLRGSLVDSVACTPHEQTTRPPHCKGDGRETRAKMVLNQLDIFQMGRNQRRNRLIAAGGLYRKI